MESPPRKLSKLSVVRQSLKDGYPIKLHAICSGVIADVGAAVPLDVGTVDTGVGLDVTGDPEGSPPVIGEAVGDPTGLLLSESVQSVTPSEQQMHSISPQSINRVVTYAQSEDGIVPDNSLAPNDNQVRLDKLDIDAGIVPVRLLS